MVNTASSAGGGNGRIFEVEASGSLTIRNLRIIDGYGHRVGGAIYSAGALNIVDSKFSGNSAQDYGGAIFVSAGEATISNIEIQRQFYDQLEAARYTFDKGRNADHQRQRAQRQFSTTWRR